MAHDIDKLFARVGTHPAEDLARGHSFLMGCFGDDEQCHSGLSGYGMLTRGVAGAIEDLRARMGFEREVGYVTIFTGREVGTGPDGEELFAPLSIVVSIEADNQSVEAVLSILAQLGIVDDK